MTYEVAPERLGRWLERFAIEHGEPLTSSIEDEHLVFAAADGWRAVASPPFPPVVGDLVEHVCRERRVGVLLVRLGACACGVFEGRRLVKSKVERQNVHGRHKKGGSSANRFRRRRDNQVRASLDSAVALAHRVLDGESLDAFVTGGDRRALATVVAQLPWEPEARVLDVPEPRLAVLESTPELFLATRLRVLSNGSH